MELSRRSFLKGAIAVSVVAATPALALTNLPVIYGDGVHDDWAGLQALLSGEPFSIDGEGFVASEGRLHGGSFLLSRGLVLNCDNIEIAGCLFSYTPDNMGLSLLEIGHNTSNCRILHNTFVQISALPHYDYDYPDSSQGIFIG